MFHSKHIDVKRHSGCFLEIEKHFHIFFGIEFIRLSNRGVLSAASCIYSPDCDTMILLVINVLCCRQQLLLVNHMIVTPSV